MRYPCCSLQAGEESRAHRLQSDETGAEAQAPVSSSVVPKRRFDNLRSAPPPSLLSLQRSGGGPLQRRGQDARHQEQPPGRHWRAAEKEDEAGGRAGSQLTASEVLLGPRRGASCRHLYSLCCVVFTPVEIPFILPLLWSHLEGLFSEDRHRLLHLQA